VGAEFITLVPTVTLAVLAVWWFRSSSILGGNKDKDEAEEAEKKEVGDSKDAATGGANTQGVQTAGPAGGPTGKPRGADSGHSGSNGLGATNTASQGGQSAGGGGGRNLSEEGSRRRPRRNGHVSDDVEQGLGVGIGSSQSTS
jgi:hypothetical protein